MVKITGSFRKLMMNRISEKSGGFIATTAIVLLSVGGLAFVLTTMSATLLYADSVNRREVRIQKRLNEAGCRETEPLLRAKDYFIRETIRLSDLECVLEF